MERGCCHLASIVASCLPTSIEPLFGSLHRVSLAERCGPAPSGLSRYPSALATIRARPLCDGNGCWLARQDRVDAGGSSTSTASPPGREGAAGGERSAMPPPGKGRTPGDVGGNAADREPPALTSTGPSDQPAVQPCREIGSKSPTAAEAKDGIQEKESSEGRNRSLPVDQSGRIHAQPARETVNWNVESNAAGNTVRSPPATGVQIRAQCIFQHFT